MAFVLPPKEKVGYLDPEIAGEGMRVITSEGDQLSWTPPPAKPSMPDWSQIKSIQKYFGRTGFQVWPAWLYHPEEEPRLLKNAQEAAQIGICYREATIEERGKYGVKAVWDWEDGVLWRPNPYERDLKFNLAKLGQGKTYVPSTPNPVIAQNELVRALIPEVAAAVAQALKGAGPAAPASINPKEWDDFLAFQAWKKSTEAVHNLVEPSSGQGLGLPIVDNGVNALNALSVDEERLLWEEEAKTKGIKVDGRWSLARLKEEVERAEKAE
jgi:hypothetical protein